MKHIFHIHSQINLLISCCIITAKKLDKNDVLFMCFRGVQGFDKLGSSVHLPNDVYYHPYNSPRNLYKLKFFKNYKFINDIDALISSFCELSEFTYYVPHCKNPLYQIVISNDRCVQVHYIEDGGDAYLTKKELLNKFPKKLHWSHHVSQFLLQFIPSSGAKRLKARANLYESIGVNDSCSFGLSEKSFKSGINKKLKSFDINNNVKNLFKTNVKFDSLFVFDAIVEQNVVTLLEFQSFVEWFIDQFDVASTGLSIKFHPAQTQESKSAVIDTLKRNSLKFEEVEPDSNMEVFLLSNDKVNIYGVGSSLLKYSLMKNPSKTFILFPYFTKLNNQAKTRKSTWLDLFGDISLPEVK